MLSKKISSLQHDIVKRARKLRESSSSRKEEGVVLVSGAKILLELAPHVTINRLFYSEGKAPLKLQADELIEVTEGILKKITGHPSPDGYAAEVLIPKPANATGKKSLALDSVQDPNNLGAILRSALAFGIDSVILLPGCADPFHEKAIQAARGAQFNLPLLFMEALPDKPVFGAALNGSPISATSFPDSFILALGNEGHGLSPQIENTCTKITIPIQGVESLNVSVAAGIFLYELSRN